MTEAASRPIKCVWLYSQCTSSGRSGREQRMLPHCHLPMHLFRHRHTEADPINLLLLRLARLNRYLQTEQRAFGCISHRGIARLAHVLRQRGFVGRQAVNCVGGDREREDTVAHVIPPCQQARPGRRAHGSRTDPVLQRHAVPRLATAAASGSVPGPHSQEGSVSSRTASVRWFDS